MCKRVMTEERIAEAQRMRTDGMFYSEIAEVLGVGYSTIRSSLAPGVQEKNNAYSRSHYAKNSEQLKAIAKTYRSGHLEETKRYNAAYRSTHKEEAASSMAAYRISHEQEIRDYRSAYSMSHKEEKSAYNKSYNADHKEERKLRDAENYRSNREKRRAQHLAWRAGHKQEIEDYYKDHKAEYCAYAATRRALKAGFLLGATAAQKAEIAEIYRKAREEPNIRCYLCGEMVPLGSRHVDHISPLSRGGEHRPSNLAVACATCNLKKNDKLPEEMGLLI